MKAFTAISFLLLLSFVSVTAAQTPASTTAAANKAWPTFWREFSAAIAKKDRPTIRKVMPSDFFDGGGGMSPDEWLKYIDENTRKGSWKAIQRSVAKGAIVSKQWSAKGTPTRVTRDNAYYFEFRKDKKWYFAGVVGD
jgi:hypothetical protein